MIDKYITVCGISVRLRPYTEKRMKQLQEVNNEIDTYIDKNPGITIEDIDRKQIAKWWKAKADVMWEPVEPLRESFFESDDFESSMLRDSEALFLTNKQYL